MVRATGIRTHKPQRPSRGVRVRERSREKQRRVRELRNHHSRRQQNQTVACRAAIHRQIAGSFYVQITRPSPRRIRLFLKLRRSLARSGARGETARDRFLRLRPRRLARGAVRDRAHSRFGFFGEKWRDDYRHRSSGAAGLGRFRDRLLHSLFRLQRHLSFQGAGASERQHRRLLWRSRRASARMAAS